MDKLIKRAFTLIELLVVIAIIGILSGLIVVSMSGVTQKANIAKAQVFSNSLRNSLMSNIVSEWKLNQVNAPSTDQTPDSWGSNNGTLKEAGYASACDSTHCPQLVSSGCVSSSCFYFDGTNDYIDFGNTNLQLTSNFSISFWFKPNNITAYSHILGKWKEDNLTGWGITMTSAHLDLGIRNGPSANYWRGTGDTALVNDQWYFVYMGYKGDGTTPNLYINGHKEVLTQTAFAGTGGFSGFTDSGESFTIGRSHIFSGSSFYYVKGSISEIRMYNDVAPLSQIKEQYYAGLNSLFINNGTSKEEYLQKLEEVGLSVK